MRITVEIDPREDATTEALAAWLAAGKALDSGPVVLKAYQSGDQSVTMIGDVTTVDRSMDKAVVDAPMGAATDGDPDDGADEGEQPASGLPPGVEQPKNTSRRGPRAGRQGSKTAAEQAAALSGQPSTDAETQSAAAQPETVNSSLPPGVTAVTAPVVPAAQQPQAAMPKAEPSNGATDPNGHMLLEDFKAQCMQIQNEAKASGKTAAYPFNVMRQPAWPDGSAKSFACMNADNVPPDQRQAVIEHSLMALNG